MLLLEGKELNLGQTNQKLTREMQSDKNSFFLKFKIIFKYILDSNPIFFLLFNNFNATSFVPFLWCDVTSLSLSRRRFFGRLRDDARQ